MSPYKTEKRQKLAKIEYRRNGARIFHNRSQRRIAKTVSLVRTLFPHIRMRTGGRLIFVIRSP